jgi:putative heme-binding domain-containing protein
MDSMLALVLSLMSLGSTTTADAPGFSVPKGFQTFQLADGSLAPDIHCLTLDPTGRVVVSGRGYVRLLLDDNADGKADRFLEFTGAPKDGAMGLLWDKDDLYCVGDGGLLVWRNANGKGRLSNPEMLFRCRTGSEHLAHAVRRGPDGYFYLLVGDQTGITKSQISADVRSPVRDPVGGCVLRFSPDFKTREIVADGLRNAYGMDFNLDGELFTYDSDNERCVSLPWYEGTRLLHLAPGSHHGWRNPTFGSTWRMPSHFLDTTPALLDLGRGSPTGVICYRGLRFPEKYHGCLFLLDWTFGRIYHAQLTKKGSSYSAKSEIFLQSVGDDGFAPVAAAVDRAGDLFVAIGGRGTRGAVYCIRYPGEGKPAGKVVEPVRSLEWKENAVKDATHEDWHTRRRALELIWRHRERVNDADLIPILRDNAGLEDRLLRQATARLFATLSEPSQKRLLSELTHTRQRRTLTLGQLYAGSKVDLSTFATDELDIEAVRLIQLSLGGLGSPSLKNTAFEGYTSRIKGATLPTATVTALRKALFKAKGVLFEEIARTLAMVEDDDSAVYDRLCDAIDEKSHPGKDVHTLIALSCLRADLTESRTEKIASALLSVDKKCQALGLQRDRNWPQRIAEIHRKLAGRDAKLDAVIVAHREFGRPEHVLFCRRSGFDRKKAGEIFLKRANGDGEYAWNAELITLIGELPASRALPALRPLWGEKGLDEAILRVLGREPEVVDRERFLTGLGSARVDTMSVALTALEKLPVDKTPAEAFALIKALKFLGAGKEEDKLRSRILTHLTSVTGEKLTNETAFTWLSKHHPKLAETIGDDGVDVAGWKKRLAKVAWDKGDVARGKIVFTKTSCATCHSGSAALGPDLQGITGRFSREDLMTAILQPSKDVSARYRTTQLVTAAGKVYQGIIVYEATDSVLMLTGPGESIRLANTQISERRLTTTSLMPTGLLDRVKDDEIADLFVYLKSLGGK